MTIEERLAALEEKVSMLGKIAEMDAKAHLANVTWQKEATESIKELTEGFAYLSLKIITEGKNLS